MLETLREVGFTGRRIFFREQRRCGRRAVRAASVMREADAVRREPVEVGRLKIRLAVAAQIAAREAVALDDNDAGPVRQRDGGRDIGEERRKLGTSGQAGEHGDEQK